MSNKSSIDYLFERFYANEGMITTKQLEQAKAMHEEEIMESYASGSNDRLRNTINTNYYNETYGGNK